MQDPNRTPRRFPLPDDESERLKALRELTLLDTSPEEAYDEVAKLASEICGTPIAIIGFIDETRHWFKAAVGVGEITKVPRDVSFCTHAIMGSETFVVPDATLDPRFCDTPQVTALGLQYYAGTPLRSDAGQNVGTLCVLDAKPRTLSEFQLKALRVLANQVETHFKLRMRLADVAKGASEIEEKHIALVAAEAQKKQLMEFVVHDLKNPIATMMNDAEYLLGNGALVGETREAVDAIAGGADSLHRMVSDLLDMNREDGGGVVRRVARVDVAALVKDVARLAERRAALYECNIVVDVNDIEVIADADVLSRVLRNLVDNAIKYGGKEIRLEGHARGGWIELAVRDQGSGVPVAARAAIFERYARLDTDVDHHARESQGIGLSFCKSAVEAHGGTITVEDNVPYGAVFRISLPLAEPASVGAPAH